MKKCSKCSYKMHRELAICEKCAMPTLIEPESNHFPKPIKFIELLNKIKFKKIQDTKPIPLFDDNNNLKSLKVEDVYIDSGVDLFSSKEKEDDTHDKSKANKTISIPLFRENSTKNKMPQDKSGTARIPMIDEFEDEESEELIISDFDSETDEIEDLGYEPEIVGISNDFDSANTDDSSDYNDLNIDMDCEYMPLPGNESIKKEEEEEEEKLEEEEQFQENKQTQKISRLAKTKLNVEYVSQYPDAWEWVLFENDAENHFGYQISGREKMPGKLDFLVFPGENLSASVMSKITDEQKDELRMLLKRGHIIESIRNLRKSFKALPFRQAWDVVRSFARQEKCKVEHFSMTVDHLPAKDRKVILRILRQGKTLEAIYLFRNMTKLGLKDSREQIEYLCEKENLAYNPLNVSTQHLVIRKKPIDGFVIVIRLLMLSLIGFILWIIFF